MIIQVPDYIRSLVPYVPGKPIEETQREFKIKKVIKMASNENSLGPSPLARRAITKVMKDLHRYPDAGGFILKKALSEHLGVMPSSLILGNGSNEIIDQLIRTFCIPGDAIVTHQASFIAYKICAQIHGVETLEARLDPDLNFDRAELVDMVKRNSRARLVFLANPNNPTGNYLPIAELKKLIAEISAIRGGAVLFVLDAAYWEYVTAEDLPDMTSLLKSFPNLVVLRTFSKVYGLAGLRVGYGIASPEIIANLEKVRQPFNLNSLAMVGATAALADHSFIKKTLRANQTGMKFWEKKLGQMSIPFWKSQGNFLLIDTERGLGKSGLEVYQACLRKGVIFRPVANYGLTQALRITVGTPEENLKAVKVLK